MRAAAIFQLSGPSDLIGTMRNATTVPIIVATAIQGKESSYKEACNFKTI